MYINVQKLIKNSLVFYFSILGILYIKKKINLIKYVGLGFNLVKIWSRGFELVFRKKPWVS